MILPHLFSNSLVQGLTASLKKTAGELFLLPLFSLIYAIQGFGIVFLLLDIFQYFLAKNPERLFNNTFYTTTF